MVRKRQEISPHDGTRKERRKNSYARSRIKKLSALLMVAKSHPTHALRSPNQVMVQMHQEISPHEKFTKIVIQNRTTKQALRSPNQVMIQIRQEISPHDGKGANLAMREVAQITSNPRLLE